jgi:hypothetical protein
MTTSSEISSYCKNFYEISTTRTFLEEGNSETVRRDFLNES